MRYTLSIPILFILLINACTDHTENSLDPSIHIDGLAREVKIPSSPTRVITLAPSLTEIVYAAGAGYKLVGVSTADDFPESVDSLPRFSILPVDFEAIASLDPDLALASDQINSPRDADVLLALGIPTYFLASRSISDVIQSITTVGELLGTPGEARYAADSLNDQLDSLRTITQRADVRPSVLFLISENPLFSFGSESYVHELIEIAGGTSATGHLEAAAPVLSEEFVLITNPDIIIGTFGSDFTAQHLVNAHPTWAVINAVKRNQVYTIEESLVQRPGPRLVDAAWKMARFIHPQLFTIPPGRQAISPSS